MPLPMQFLSDNAASVHPRLWAAMQAADEAQPPYDGDALSARLDEAFSAVFARPCVALWVASGTAANGLALASLVQPHGAVVCHRQAHIEQDECGAPALFTHGAKLLLLEGADAKLAPDAVERLIASQRGGVHSAPIQALSITQASEAGCAYRPQEVAALGAVAARHGLGLHMDGARFANAVAHLGCSPAAASCEGGVDVLSFGFVKNGGMNAEALVFFNPQQADLARYGRKRSGHLQSKGRYMAAQLLAMLEGDLWLANAAHANAAAAEIGGAAAGRLLHPVQANEVFLALSAAEKAALRAQGFGFYDWGEEGARFVTAWNAQSEPVAALARALAAL
jgi:threonine aldolase